MAGQGLNLGIADADALARAVLEGRSSGTDVGSKTLLGRYEEERKVGYDLIFAFILIFVKSFFGQSYHLQQYCCCNQNHRRKPRHAKCNRIKSIRIKSNQIKSVKP